MQPANRIVGIALGIDEYEFRILASGISDLTPDIDRALSTTDVDPDNLGPGNLVDLLDAKSTAWIAFGG